MCWEGKLLKCNIAKGKLQHIIFLQEKQLKTGKEWPKANMWNVTPSSSCAEEHEETMSLISHSPFTHTTLAPLYVTSFCLQIVINLKTSPVYLWIYTAPILLGALLTGFFSTCCCASYHSKSLIKKKEKKKIQFQRSISTLIFGFNERSTNWWLLRRVSAESWWCLALGSLCSCST